ncbi:MAG: hypothetical protein BMS9Abin15_0614 [Gammaproteobacteria bacterium]|nr:MAG: hypothetical protein BMS9Abin15_0614 [Gammaproteobacteria bacterium]
MKINKASPPVRFYLFIVGAVTWLGIWHTGFAVASWLLYIPAVFLVLAAVSGYCPGLIISHKLIGKTQSDTPALND